MIKSKNSIITQGYKQRKNRLIGVTILLAVLTLCLCCVFVAACGLSLVKESGGWSSCSAQASHCRDFSCCGARALESKLSSYGTWA